MRVYKRICSKQEAIAAYLYLPILELNVVLRPGMHRRHDGLRPTRILGYHQRTHLQRLGVLRLFAIFAPVFSSRCFLLCFF